MRFLLPGKQTGFLGSRLQKASRGQHRRRSAGGLHRARPTPRHRELAAQLAHSVRWMRHEAAGQDGAGLSWPAAESGRPLLVPKHSASAGWLPGFGSPGAGGTRTGSALSAVSAKESQLRPVLPLWARSYDAPSMLDTAGCDTPRPASFSPNGLHETETPTKVRLV